MIIIFIVLASNVLALKPTIEDPINHSSGAGSSVSRFEEMLINVMSWVWPISIVIAVLMVLIGAYYFVFSAGDPAKVATGKKVIIYALIGLAIVGLSIGIWELIKLILGI